MDKDIKENQNHYTVYMHKNKENGKVYIGMTGREPSKRWGHNGYCYIGQSYFYNAILKYGWDNFEHIILEKNLSKNEAELLEIELIKKYNSRDKQYGYNILSGGNCVELNQESRDKISKSKKGQPSWIKGKHHSEETKCKIGDANRKIFAIHQYDKKNGKYIRTFSSLKEASLCLNIRQESISSVCLYESKSIGGYIFRYANENLVEGEDLSKQEFERSKNTHLRPVKQYTKDGIFIKEYPSIKDAEIALGKQKGKTLIWHCVNHKKPSALGYLWSYSDEDVVIPNNKISKPINQYDTNYNLIQKFNSVKEAASCVGVCYDMLLRHLKNKNKTLYKGYLWEYVQ